MGSALIPLCESLRPLRLCGLLLCLLYGRDAEDAENHREESVGHNDHFGPNGRCLHQ